jgi:acyl-CoA synthetase (NDP forming)
MWVGADTQPVVRPASQGKRKPSEHARIPGRAVRYGAWRAEPREPVPSFPDLNAADARAVVYRFLDDAPDGGWLPPGPTADLLRCYGIMLTALIPVASEDEAAAAATATDGPVVLKAYVPGLVHKTDVGAVALDLRTEGEVRAAYRTLQERFAGRPCRILLQPMITGGAEVIVGVADDRMFGPLVVFGLGGVATEVLADHAARLTPLTVGDADHLIRSLRSAPLLLGHRGAPAADLGALRELLLRVSRLADDLPEITDLDLNPVIARPDGAFAVDARVKVAPYQPEDPYLRKLR